MKSDILITKITARTSEIDPYGIVHHANYYNWVELCLKQYMSEYMLDWMKEKNWSSNDGLITKFHCKYIYSTEEGMKLSIQTILKKMKEEDTGAWLSFKHLITEEKTRRKLASLETEMFFQIIEV